MQSRSATAAVFFASLILLGWNAGGPGIATSYVDPLAKIQAQDEAYYGAISIDMADHGHWLTPRFLGRYALTKPPLLYWLEAPLVKLLPRAQLAWALRLPAVIAGAAAATLVFWWVFAESGAPAAGLAAALLLLSSHLFFVVSRTGLTDALLTFFTALAMLALARDPKLASPQWLWAFGLASGAAILTKGLAGLFALLALAVFWVISRERPPWRRLAEAVAISAAVGLPWHLYELARHTRWFWAEYVVSEVVTNSVGSPSQTTQESQIGYYARRLAALDAPLLLFALLALARKRPRAALAWLAVVLAAALSFEYRNTTYLTPALPAMAVLAGLAIPKRWANWALAAAAVLFAGKAIAHSEPWGLPFGAESVIAAEPALDRYGSMNRANELIIGNPDDGFYSACLNLPQVRYLYLDQGLERRHLALDFDYLGVTMTADDFRRLAEVRPEFDRRLLEWGLNVQTPGGQDPVASVILAPGMDEIRALVHDHPQTDFYLPVSWAEADAGVHAPVDTGSGYELLLSRSPIQRLAK